MSEEPVTLPQGAKPSKVVSRDEARPTLTVAYVENEVLYATDGYHALKLPVPGVQDGVIPRAVLEAAEKKGSEFKEQTEEVVRVLTKDGTVVEGERRDVGKFPDLEKVIPKPPKKAIRFAINAKLLLQLAVGLGDSGVVLTLDANHTGPEQYLRPILVEPLSGDGLGVVMPIHRTV